MLRLDSIEEEVLRLFNEQVDNSMTISAEYYARRLAGAEGAEIPAEDVTMTVFDPLLVGVASADDPIFEELKKPEAVGSQFMPPCEWVEGAKSVVSIFFPFEAGIVMGNRDSDLSSIEWQYAKYQGTKIIGALCNALCDQLKADGWEAVMPAGSGRFSYSEEPCTWGDKPDFNASSVWSERHIAYACGLGTFGLSRGLVTRKGIAGRFGSIVTNAPITPTSREYTDIYEWCTFCGACVKRCPANAISLTEGKCNTLCEQWCKSVPEGDVYGDACGKCQTAVPCARRKPVSLKPKPRPKG